MRGTHAKLQNHWLWLSGNTGILRKVSVWILTVEEIW